MTHYRLNGHNIRVWRAWRGWWLGCYRHGQQCLWFATLADARRFMWREFGAIQVDDDAGADNQAPIAAH